MKILFVSAVFPYPLYSGGQVRIYNLLKLLSQKHSISLFCFIRDSEEAAYREKVSFCENVETVLRGRAWQFGYVTRSIVGIYPLLYASYNLTEMRLLIAKKLRDESFDLVHIEPSYVWPSLPKLKTPVVVGEHNIEYQVYERYVSHFSFVPLRPILAVDVLKHKYWEHTVWRRANHIIAVSNEDKSLIEGSSISTPVSLVPNGVDTSYFTYHKRQQRAENPVCLFIGDFAWMQNRDSVRYLAEEIWPEIKRVVPGATLRIIGRNLSRALRDAIVRAGAEVIESVGDIRPEYEKATFLLAPIRIGGGTKFKILEAMASGLPVVATSLGAQGLSVENGKNLTLAETPAEFAQSIKRLSFDTLLVNRMSSAARRIIEKNYSWTNIAKELAAAWEKTRENNH